MNRRLVWGAAAALIVAACWPVTTRYGVNYRWSSRTITLFEKSVHFISRDLQTRRLVKELLRGVRPGDPALMRLFEWTVANIHPTPEGLPVVDDHPLHILIRGYGAEDQRTEAFALLASYAGFPSAAVTLRAPGTDAGLLVAAVRAGSQTFIFDVINGVAFQDEQGRFVDLMELSRNPLPARRAAGDLTVAGIPYARFFEEADRHVTSFDRMEAQKPWSRLRQEVTHLFRPLEPAR